MRKYNLAEMLEWKYGPVANTAQEDPTDMKPNSKMVISGWRHPTISEPSAVQINKDMAEYTVWRNTQPPEVSMKDKLIDLEARIAILEGA